MNLLSMKSPEPAKVEECPCRWMVSVVFLELLKCALGPVCRALHSLFIQVWRSGIVPADWQASIIITLYKGKGPRTVCSNYRPITLLSCLARYSPMFCWHAYNLLSTSLVVLSNQASPLADQPLTPSSLCDSCQSCIVNFTDH